MLVRANSFSVKPISRDVVGATTFQGSSNFDHLKKAAESLVRQQHSDKTDFELAAQKIRTLEYEKSELVETNTKLLEAKVKLETIAQTAKKNYDALRFDCIATDTVCKSIQEHVADTQKRSTTINNEIAFLKDRVHKLQHLCESFEAILSKELVSSRELKAQMATVNKERDSAVRKNEDLSGQLQALSGSLNTSNIENERLKKIVEEQSIQMQISKGERDVAEQKSVTTQDELRRQIRDKEQFVEQLSEELRKRNFSAEESESKLRLELEQSLQQLNLKDASVTELQTLLSASSEKCKEWESLVFVSSEKNKELENDRIQYAQSVEDLRRKDQLKFEQECEVLEKEVAKLREGLALAQTETTGELQKLTADLAEARDSLDKALKDNEQREVSEANTLEKTKEQTVEYEVRESGLKADIENCKKIIAEMRTEKEVALRAQQAGFNSMKDTLISDAQKTEKDLVTQLSEALEKVSTLNRDKDNLADDVATLATKLNETQKDLEEAQQQYKKTNNKVNKADNKQIENLNQLLEKQNKEILDLKRQLRASKPSLPSSASSSSTPSSTPSSSTSSSSKFLIQTKDVPTSSEDRDTTEDTDSAPTPSASKSNSSSSKKEEPKKKRQLRNTGGESASPSKRVHFSLDQQTKKAATFAKRKAATKSKSPEFDEYTFRG